jgi:drug/metabolite transporter (DMT)-like permease
VDDPPKPNRRQSGHSAKDGAAKTMTNNTLHRPMIAAAFMMGSVTSFTLMAIAARQIGGRHDTFEIMTARSVIGLGLVLIVAMALGRLSDISATRLPGHLLRNIVHFTGQNLWFLALTLAPLAQVFALEFTSPLWVILLAPLLLGERFSGRRLLAVAIGITGILVITQPWLQPPNLGVLAPAGSAVFFAMTSILTKRLTRAETIISILFWLTLMQLVFGLIAAGHDGHWLWPDRSTLPWLGLIGVTGVTAHLCLTNALRLAPASFVMPIDFIRLPLIAALGAVFYAEPLDPAILIGGAIIVIGIYVNLTSSRTA